MRAARALAALEGKTRGRRLRTKRVAPMALSHRLRRNPLDDSGSATRVEPRDRRSVRAHDRRAGPFLALGARASMRARCSRSIRCRRGVALRAPAPARCATPGSRSCATTSRRRRRCGARRSAFPTTACSAASISPRRLRAGRPVARTRPARASRRRRARARDGRAHRARRRRAHRGALDRGEVSAERDGFSLAPTARSGSSRSTRATARTSARPPALLERLAFWIDLAPGQRARHRRAPRLARGDREGARAARRRSRRATRRSPHWSASPRSSASTRCAAPLLALRAARAAAALRGGDRSRKPTSRSPPR